MGRQKKNVQTGGGMVDSQINQQKDGQILKNAWTGQRKDLGDTYLCVLLEKVALSQSFHKQSKSTVEHLHPRAKMKVPIAF